MVTQDDIDSLNAIIASGARSGTLGGQTVTFNTTASLIQARDDMVKQLRQQNGKAKRKQTLMYQSGRGYE